MEPLDGIAPTPSRTASSTCARASTLLALAFSRAVEGGPRLVQERMEQTEVEVVPCIALTDRNEVCVSVRTCSGPHG